MSDLTREQIEAMREQALSENGSWITQNNLKALCDMALASIDLRARLAQAERERDEARSSYRCYACKQVFAEDHGHGLAREHFGTSYRGELPKCIPCIDNMADWSGGPHDPFVRVRKSWFNELLAKCGEKPYP